MQSEAFPADDPDYQDVIISSVEVAGKSWAIGHSGGFHLYCGDDCPIEPKAGLTARIYPAGIGNKVRGLFIDGVRIWYRTAAEQKEHIEIALYGADAADWLRRWDEGRAVFSIEMGGIGPGYEQCIHITAAEMLRWLIENNADASLWDDPEAARPVFDRMEKALFEVERVTRLGLSGAQWGAARNLAAQFYRRGPRAVLADPEVKDRLIQVSSKFPGAQPAKSAESCPMPEHDAPWTPGPWAVSEDPRDGMEWNRHIVLVRDYDCRICFMANGGPERDDEFLANAMLIAAAPALYEALSGLRDAVAAMYPRYGRAVEDAVCKANGALALARGETND